MKHEVFMKRCLQLAKIGLANAAPNPSVGAVLVYEDVIIAEGYTSPYGGAHAEVNCIQNVPIAQQHLISKSTLYVSLEPCAHFGKTPPCSVLIVEQKIPRVVIGCLDTNTLVSGKGIQLLQENGIETLVGVLEEECKESNKRFFTFQEKKRPYIILKWAQSKDGYMAPLDAKQLWLTNKHTKAFVHSIRAQEMGILVGENTILVDNPRLNTRLIKGKNPIRIVINTKQTLPDEVKLFTDGGRNIIFTLEVKEDHNNTTFIQLEKQNNSIQQILDVLYQNNISSVLVEGGAYTLQEFIKAKCWDEAIILTAPKELKEGLLAPKVEGKTIETFSIKTDSIKKVVNTL